MLRGKLHNLWQAMSVHGVYSPYNYSGASALAEQWGKCCHGFFQFAFTSPYQNNPFNIHFLKELLKNINFDELNHNCAGVRLFVSATNVLNNKLRIFTNEEPSVDVLLASSCLPKIHKAVEIDDEYFGTVVIWAILFRTS